MLRFPNPGSTIDNFVAVYRAAFERLHGRVVDLDQIVAAVVDANLATSSGFMGAEAIARSTRIDRSRDALYNQLKMYAELFRLLGWLHPTEERALNYTFTLLGHQVVAAGPYYRPLLVEALLGIAHPNHVISVKGSFDLRPFAFLLKLTLLAGGAISKPEMIVALSTKSDRSPDAVEQALAKVQQMRHSKDAVVAALNEVSRERGIALNTLGNYTRWPIATMRDCGLTEKTRLTFETGRRFEAHQLTEFGREKAQEVMAAADIRLDQLDRLPQEEKAALSIFAHFFMMDRAGFDTSIVQDQLALVSPDRQRALERLGVAEKQSVLFSPFQTLAVQDICAIFPSSEEARGLTSGGRAIEESQRQTRDHLFVHPRLIHTAKDIPASELTTLRNELHKLYESHGCAKNAASAFARNHSSDTQRKFYPLISQLFQLLGYSSDYSRAGVNYQRWDAAVQIGDFAIPVEIKSPAEELYLSTKAIRQALENKVVILARGGLSTRHDITSLIVGYHIPNDRGDMSALIDDIHGAFKIKIGVIDLGTLAFLAIRAVTENISIDPTQLSTLKGFLYV